MDFFWGQTKSLVYKTSTPSVEDIIARISVTTGNNRSMQESSGTQYGSYDPRLVTEWVRIPSKTWLYLLRERSRLSPEMDSRLERKSSAPLLVICWDHRL
ncbi:hypothetical protein TNCV_3968471 [Trichonephila clavipes]|nr:hypothetical protein TNCV_3968471 [Trichonephila clavipes]